MERYARRNRWKIAGRFVDLAESGPNRPERKRLMQYCRKSKGIDVVLVYSIDRLTRNVLDHVTIRQTLKKKGTRLVSVSEPFDDNPIGPFREDIIAAISEWRRSEII
jgi:site-specific DNA recombinase